MVTTGAVHDLHEVPLGGKTNAVLTRIAQLKRGVAEWWYSSSITATICCVESMDYDAVIADERIRGDIRREMVRTVDYVGLANGVAAAMLSVRRDIGYELAAVEEPVAVAVAVTGDGLDKVVERDMRVEQTRVCVVPRFAAAMTLHLRARLGRMAPSEANQLLMEREYNRLCRGYGVRDADIAAHYCHVKNAYFGEQVFDRIPTGRARMSRFSRWALGVNTLPVAAPQAC